MKRILFVSAAALMTFMSVQAQSSDEISKNENGTSKEDRKEVRKEKKQARITLRKMEGGYINPMSKDNFYRDFGDQPDAKWTKGSFFEEVEFMKDGIATTAYYDYDAKLVGSTCLKRFEDLPADAQKQIKKDYKDYTIENIVFFDDNENNDTDMILYNDQFDDEDNYFVELIKDNKKVIVEFTMDGQTNFFKAL